MGTIWLSLKGSVNFQLISSSSGLAMVALWYFLGSFHRPIPVRYNWNAFARKMHSTSKFAMIVLSTSVCVSTAVSAGMQSFILGRCTIVIVQGMDRTYEAPSNEAPHMILGYHQGRLYLVGRQQSNLWCRLEQMMTKEKDVQHQIAPDLEQDVVIEHPIIVTIIVIIILQGPLRDLKDVGQLEQLVLFLKFAVRRQVNGTFILVFGTHMLETLPGMDRMKQRFERSVRADLLESFVQNLLLNLCLAPKFWRHSAIKGSISMLQLKAFIASWPLSRAFPIARTNRLSSWHL